MLSSTKFWIPITTAMFVFVFVTDVIAQKPKRRVDGRNVTIAEPPDQQDPDWLRYGIYQSSAPRPQPSTPVGTTLPLQLEPDQRIALIGNGLLEQTQQDGQLEAVIQQMHRGRRLVIRNLAWSADTPDLQPRPENFADLHQHLFHQKIDVIFAAYGFNESFDGDAGIAAFRQSLSDHVTALKSHAFNGKSSAKVVLISPIANEDLPNIPAAKLNNDRIEMYADVVRNVAEAEGVGFVDLFTPTLQAMTDTATQLTFNGVHLNTDGQRLIAVEIARQSFGGTPPHPDARITQLVTDKNRQFFRRYRPLNTFYYTGGRKKSYGYLDFLPAMRNFAVMTANRERAIWKLAESSALSNSNIVPTIDDSNVLELPETLKTRGANRWMSAADELAEFQVDPRFEVSLFAGEEEFPEIAAPIQIRWDNRGRLWVACSKTYPHVYPGNEPNDKLVILEDTDGDGKADTSKVFADDLHIPLSFEFGDGGVFISEQPNLTFLKDTDGDDRADVRQTLLAGFGTEDSHHSLHDFIWTPDGDLLLRESIFHHSQIETPYGPVRQQNSGWFRFDPRSHRLTSFGTYHSTNPWGVTFDDWGQHVASHPVYAAAFHSTDPAYPIQHDKPTGLNAYSGTCGQEFVDFASFPDDVQGSYIKARYKPTNRIEIHEWAENEFGFDEKYTSDLIFSSNLSFIPVDIRFGPRGALYICDWYNPVKGHAQYSLRDDRRDRHSGRIWRVVAKGKPLGDSPKIADASIEELLDMLKRPESRIRYWVRRELRDRDASEIRPVLDRWLHKLDSTDDRFRHHQVEAMWVYRGIRRPAPGLVVDLLDSESRMARAAATRQLRWQSELIPGAESWLRRLANDPQPVVRMEAVIAASYIGTRGAFEAVTGVFDHPIGGHLAYAAKSSMNSEALRKYWAEGDDKHGIAQKIKQLRRESTLSEPTPSASQAEFDRQQDLVSVQISCLSERMKFTVEQIAAVADQPIKIVFTNPDATDHNFVLVKPGALAEVGIAANEMARDPKNAKSNFIPRDKRNLILQSSPMIGPNRRSQVHVMRFNAPKQPGVYPYVCTFPGHWIVMKGELIVAENSDALAVAVEDRKPAIVEHWTYDKIKHVRQADPTEENLMLGMAAYLKAGCAQCHRFDGQGVNLGPRLKGIGTCYQPAELLKHIVDPSFEIHDNYATENVLNLNGQIIAGVIGNETDTTIEVITNLLVPSERVKIDKQSIEQRIKSKVSAMPTGLLDTLTAHEIAQLLVFLRTDAGESVGEKLLHEH